MNTKATTVFVAASLVVAHSGSSSGITFTPLNFPGAAFTEAASIDGNNIVGVYGEPSGVQHGFLFDGVTWTTLDVPFFSYYGTRVLGVSGNRLVGEYYPGPRGFSFDGTAWTQLDYPGSANSSNQAVDGNNVVGLAGGGFHFDGTIWTPLNYPNSVFTNPLGIDGDRIVGFYETDFSLPPLRHGFVYDGAVWNALDYPGSLTTEAHGIDGNNIVGNWWDGSQGHGFLYNGASWQSFDYPGSIGTIANDISGQRLVGLYFDATGNSHSFLATIPEPNAAALCTLGAPLLRRPRGRRSHSARMPSIESRAW